MAYNPGRNKTKIEILDVVEVENGFGEYEQKEVIILKEWAEVKPLTGKEFLEQRKIESEMNYCFKMRYRKEVSEVHKVRFNNRIADIIYIAPNPTSRTMEVVVKWQTLK